MTRICIDDQVSEMGVLGSRNLAEVIQKISATLPPNRMVREIILDGKLLSKREEMMALQETLEEIQEVLIRTADREIWALDGIDAATSKLERIRYSLLKVVELFHNGDSSEAHRCFAHCLEGIERFLDAIVLTRSALQIDFSLYQVEDRTLGKLELELCQILKSILSKQEEKSNEGIADGIEFALIPNLASWFKGLKQLKRSLHSNA